MVIVSVCAVVVTGFDFLAHSVFNLRFLEMAAGPDYHGALNSTSGSDENYFLNTTVVSVFRFQGLYGLLRAFSFFSDSQRLDCLIGDFSSHSFLSSVLDYSQVSCFEDMSLFFFSL